MVFKACMTATGVFLAFNFINTFLIIFLNFFWNYSNSVSSYRFAQFQLIAMIILLLISAVMLPFILTIWDKTLFILLFEGFLRLFFKFNRLKVFYKRKLKIVQSCTLCKNSFWFKRKQDLVILAICRSPHIL